jgi:hypothetical protein
MGSIPALYSRQHFRQCSYFMGGTARRLSPLKTNIAKNGPRLQKTRSGTPAPHCKTGVLARSFQGYRLAAIGVKMDTIVAQLVTFTTGS